MNKKNERQVAGSKRNTEQRQKGRREDKSKAERSQGYSQINGVNASTALLTS